MCSIVIFAKPDNDHPDSALDHQKFKRGDVIDVHDDDDFDWGREAEISQAVAPDAHAVVLADQAGWHLTAKLDVPHNITIVPLPPRSPELNPVENVWQYMRDNWLSNRVFETTTFSPTAAMPGTSSSTDLG